MATGPGPPANETNCSKPNPQQSAGQRSTQQQHPGEQPKHPISQSLIQPAITAAGQSYVESGHRYATNGASKGGKETRSTPIPTMNDRLSNVMAVIATLVPESSQLESGIQRVRHAHSEQVTASSQRSEQDERFNAARQAVESVKKLARENELLQKENQKLHSENQQLERLLSSAERLTQVCVDQRAKITKGEERIKEQKLSIERQRASIEQKKADITEQEAKTAAYITWGETVRQHLASYPATSAPSTTRNLAQGSGNGEPSPLGLRSQSRSHPQQQSDRRGRSRSPVREDRVFPARSPRYSGLRSRTTTRAPSRGSLPSNPRNNLPPLPSRPFPGSSRKSTPSSAKTHGQKPSMTGNTTARPVFQVNADNCTTNRQETRPARKASCKTCINDRHPYSCNGENPCDVCSDFKRGCWYSRCRHKGKFGEECIDLDCRDVHDGDINASNLLADGAGINTPF